MMNVMERAKMLEKDIAKANKQMKIVDTIFGGFIAVGILAVLILSLVVA